MPSGICNSKLVENWIAAEKIFKWPTQQPDLNPIENLWELLNSSMGGVALNGRIKKTILSCKSFPQEIISNLIAALPRKCSDVIENYKIWKTANKSKTFCRTEQSWSQIIIIFYYGFLCYW